MPQIRGTCLEREIARNRSRYRTKGRHAESATKAVLLEIVGMVFQHLFSALSFLHSRRDDDFVDRMSYLYTSSFLIMMAILVSFKQFGGRPLECWVPAQFTTSWEAYTEMYCWAQNTYWLPFDRALPYREVDREYKQISYYQWVPFFLLIQAFLFYFPCMLWRLLNDKSGLRIHDIVTSATEKENIEPEFRAKTTESLCRHIEAALRYQHAASSRTSYTHHRVFRCFNLRYYESYVTGLYLVVKLFYIGNLIGNVLILNKFLQTESYSVYGFGVLRDLMEGRGWQDSGNFPRVTLCDFEVRVMGNIQRHTVQCVLVINIFNEKIFILLWLWFSFLLVTTLMDTMYWYSISIRHTDRLRFIIRHLELTEDTENFRKTRKHEIGQFLTNYVKVDGVLVLRMIALHAGIMFCTELTEALWKRFLSSKKNSATPGAVAQNISCQDALNTNFDEEEDDFASLTGSIVPSVPSFARISRHDQQQTAALLSQGNYAAPDGPSRLNLHRKTAPPVPEESSTVSGGNG